VQDRGGIGSGTLRRGDQPHGRFHRLGATFDGRHQITHLIGRRCRIGQLATEFLCCLARLSHRPLQRLHSTGCRSHGQADGRHGIGNFLRRALGLIGQLADLVGHHGKTTPRLTGPCRLDGGIEGQQVGLLGDTVDPRGQRLDIAGLGIQVSKRMDPALSRLLGAPSASDMRRAASDMALAERPKLPASSRDVRELLPTLFNAVSTCSMASERPRSERRKICDNRASRATDS
jgi:hypothetical protein